MSARCLARRRIQQSVRFLETPGGRAAESRSDQAGRGARSSARAQAAHGSSQADNSSPTADSVQVLRLLRKSHRRQIEGLFLEGDPNTGNIYAKREGDVIKDRYKLVHIGLRSVTVEDTVTHNQQTLKILDEQQ